MTWNASRLLLLEEENLALLSELGAFLEAGEPVPQALTEMALQSCTTTELKRDAYAALIRQCESLEKHCAQEIQRLQVIQERRAKAREWLKDQVVCVLKSRGVRVLHGIDSKFTLISNTPKVIVECPTSELPVEAVRVIPPVPQQFEPDKLTLRRMLEDGREVPGVRLEHSQRLKVT